MLNFLLIKFLVPFKFPVPYEPFINVDIDRTTIESAIEEALEALGKHSTRERDLIRSGIKTLSIR